MVRQNLGHGVYQAWLDATQETGQNQSKGNIFFSGPVIYSYGTHFPLAYRQPSAFIMNADTYSSTTSKHQNAVQWVVKRTGKPNLLIPFSSLRTAGIHPAEMEIVAVEEDRQVPIPCMWKRFGSMNPQHGEGCTQISPHTRHLMGRSVFRVGKDYFLSGLDETARNIWAGFFLAQLPSPAHTITAALDTLKPAEVRGAERLDYEVLRQGEFFFIPSTLKTRQLTNAQKWWYIPHIRPGRRLRHYVTESRELNDVMYCRGTVRHSGGEHKMLKLENGWYSVHENTEVASWTSFGRVD